MDFEAYKNKWELYDRFAKTVKSILDAAFQNSDPKYQLQQIQARAKTPESLYNRLKESNKLASKKVEDLRKDLAGCRIIFYHNGDVKRFLNSDIIRDNFKIIDVKLHHHEAKDEIQSSSDLYTANHYIVKLSDLRTKLAEYAQFKGLKCEIQVQTILNHAWAETEHDIIYKKISIPGFGTTLQKSIDDRLQKVMKDHIVPAGYEFEKVKFDHQRLVEGRELVGKDIEKAIISSSDNNERFEILQRFVETTLNLYDRDYIENNIGTFINIAKRGVYSSKSIKVKKIDTPYGSLEGKNSHDILDECLNILKYIRFISVESIESAFTALVEFYEKAKNEEDKKLISEAAGSLVKYRIDILKQAGLLVQDLVLAKLEKYKDKKLNNIKSLIAEICAKILDSVAEGTSWSYESIKISRGSVLGTEDTAKIRNRALKILKKIYSSKDSKEIKKQLVSAFTAATRQPTSANYKDDLLAIILTNAKEVVDFYITLIPKEDYSILESIEEDVCHLYRLAKDISEGSAIKDIACIENSKKLVKSALSFRRKLNSNKEFIIFKTLVGFESVFDPSWENSDWKIKGESEYRDAEVAKYVKRINQRSKEFWEKIIVLCGRVESNDLATFPYYGKFLNMLALEKPDFILYMLKKHEVLMSNFITSIFEGLLKSKKREDAVKVINKFIEEGKYLFCLARVFEYYQPLDEKLLSAILVKASKSKDIIALIKVMGAVAKNSDKKHLIQKFFIPALKELTKLKNTKWVNDFWYRHERTDILNFIDSKEIDLILANLIYMPEIDYHAEEILRPIAQRFPKKVIDFFWRRLAFEKEGGSMISGFTALPYKLYRLQEILSLYPKLLMNSVVHWYQSYSSLFRFTGAQFVHSVFPELTKPLEKELLKLIKTGDNDKIKIVIAIIQNYGTVNIHAICKELIKVLPESSSHWSGIMIALEHTPDGVTGEYGYVEAYKIKKQEVSSWLKSRNPKIKKFAKKYTDSLDKQIIAEKGRAKDNIIMRKHMYGAENE